MANPYSPPTPELQTESRFTLYSPGQMAWATFLGAPVAGCILLALNYARLGNSGASRISIGMGVVATCLLLGISFFLPDEAPSSILAIAYTFAVYQLAKSLQGSDFQHHLSEGGTRGSSWIATGVGILCMLAIFVAVIFVVLALPEEWLGEDF
ncbi:MAG: hypothetical protein AAF664_01625 [Planctomycetota bacterium]